MAIKFDEKTGFDCTPAKFEELVEFAEEYYRESSEAREAVVGAKSEAEASEIQKETWGKLEALERDASDADLDLSDIHNCIGWLGYSMRFML